MPKFQSGNVLWKRRIPPQNKGNSLKVLRPPEEVNYWREVLEMAKQQKDYKALMQALEIISVIQRGKPATQQPVKSREKTDQLSSLMSEVFRAKPAGKNTVTQSNQSDTDE